MIIKLDFYIIREDNKNIVKYNLFMVFNENYVVFILICGFCVMGFEFDLYYFIISRLEGRCFYF